MSGSPLADHVDDLGIAILASPYVAKAVANASAGTPALEPVHNASEGYAEKFDATPYGELAGLALVAPAISNRLAKGLEHGLGYLKQAAYLAGVKHAREQLSVGGYTRDEAKKLFKGEHVNMSEATDGLNDELEHRDVTHGNDAMTKRIVEDHLRQHPDYYSRLQKAGL